ncbi:DUF6332 family protein [Streptomyces sp. NPDC048659]|uniref:DUF6332 family protein n=1 Tax=Streptomyces sp. NPDC048659 TaxID=3155489 RepID=UPI00342D8DE0
MDMGHESRGEKDAMTVEIVFALVTATVLAAAVFAAVAVLSLPFDLSGRTRELTLKAGAVLGGAAGVWRVVRVLVRFDRHRRLGR